MQFWLRPGGIKQDKTMNTPKNLQEVLAIEDIATKIAYLKKGRRTEMPKVDQLRDDWEPLRHDIMDSRSCRVMNTTRRLV